MTRFMRGAFMALAALCPVAPFPALAQVSHNAGNIPAYDTGLDKTRVTGDIVVAGATFTTPAGTTAYSSGDLIANSGTAASVTPLQFTVCRVNQGTGALLRARIKTTETGQAGKVILLKLYRSDPSASSGITNGDNGAWLTKEADYFATISVTLDQHFSDFEKGVGILDQGSIAGFDCGSGSQLLYGLLVQGAGGSGTLVGAKTYTAVLETEVN